MWSSLSNTDKRAPWPLVLASDMLEGSLLVVHSPTHAPGARLAAHKPLVAGPERAPLLLKSRHPGIMKISVTKKIFLLYGATSLVATSLVATSLVAMATRVVVVTGANRGIGFAIARNILRNISGAHVWLGSKE